MVTITCINQKGGVGKTSTALATAHGLIKRGYKVLFIDLDPQKNASSVLQVKDSEYTSLDVIKGLQIEDAITDKEELLHVIAADDKAASADKQIDGVGAEYKLKEALQTVKDKYDFCIIDTPPALGILTINALTAAYLAVIPAQADLFSLEGIAQLATTLQAVKTYSNSDLNIAGILLTRYNGRTTLAREIHEAAEDAAQALDTKVFNATIREGIAMREAQALNESIFEYAPKARITEDLDAYIDELIEGVNHGKNL